MARFLNNDLSELHVIFNRKEVIHAKFCRAWRANLNVDDEAIVNIVDLIIQKDDIFNAPFSRTEVSDLLLC